MTLEEATADQDQRYAAAVAHARAPRRRRLAGQLGFARRSGQLLWIPKHGRSVVVSLAEYERRRKAGQRKPPEPPEEPKRVLVVFDFEVGGAQDLHELVARIVDKAKEVDWGELVVSVDGESPVQGRFEGEWVGDPTDPTGHKLDDWLAPVLARLFYLQAVPELTERYRPSRVKPGAMGALKAPVVVTVYLERITD